MTDKPVLVVSRKAQIEIQEAYDWYEEQQAGLGQEFVDFLTSFCRTLVDFPRKYRKIEGKTHLAILPRFPYCIYFDVLPDQIRVISVVHGKRHPDTWKNP